MTLTRARDNEEPPFLERKQGNQQVLIEPDQILRHVNRSGLALEVSYIHRFSSLSLCFPLGLRLPWPGSPSCFSCFYCRFSF